MSKENEIVYLKSHEWIRDNKDGTYTVGITDHAQEQLGDLVYIELPKIGETYQAGDPCAVVESVKTAADVFAPMTGVVAEVNTGAVDAPERVNQSAEDQGWLFVIRPEEKGLPDEILDLSSYREFLESDA